MTRWKPGVLSNDVLLPPVLSGAFVLDTSIVYEEVSPKRRVVRKLSGSLVGTDGDRCNASPACPVRRCLRIAGFSPGVAPLEVIVIQI